MTTRSSGETPPAGAPGEPAPVRIPSATAGGDTVQRRQTPPVRPAVAPSRPGTPVTAGTGGRTGEIPAASRRRTPEPVTPEPATTQSGRATRVQRHPPGTSTDERPATGHQLHQMAAMTATTDGDGDGEAPSSSARVDLIDELVDAIEDRVLAQLDRRGGRYQGVW